MRRAAASLMLAAAQIFAPAAQAFEACVPGDGRWVERVCFTAWRDVPIYGHDIIGKVPEWSGFLVVYGPDARVAGGGSAAGHEVVVEGGIFEDIAPRLADIDGDGLPEAIVVQTDYELGARLMILGIGPELSVKAATPYIGQPRRWLAPVGVGDMDGDGQVEIAYVDRPHLLRELVVLRYQAGGLVEIARIPGLTNHQIGDGFIQGGMRQCGGRPEIILADGAWARVMRVRWNGAPEVADLGAYSPAMLAQALGCP
jgi:hypothetical protein